MIRDTAADPQRAAAAVDELAALGAVRGLLDAVITQNIDGLHQEAGSRRVVRVVCLPRRTPSIPTMPISRATWSRPTSWPALRIAVANLSAP